MSCCKTLNDQARGCGPIAGGIKKAWVQCFGSGSIIPKGDGTASLASKTSSNCWTQLNFFKQTGNFSTEFQYTDGIGISHYETSIELVFSKLQLSTAVNVQSLAGSELSMIVLDNNNQYWVFGIDYPVIVTAGTGDTGTSFTDANGYTLTFTSTETALPLVITDFDYISLTAPDLTGYSLYTQSFDPTLNQVMQQYNANASGNLSTITIVMSSITGSIRMITKTDTTGNNPVTTVAQKATIAQYQCNPTI